jgi:quercetin dioxygenase-like cupin family protein
MSPKNFIPQRISWPGIAIVEDVADSKVNQGIDTLEGRIGPLIKGDSSKAHFIEMPGGLFCQEHSHSTESLIFTVKGQWVLCSQGRRQLMKPGTLFWFKAGTPTGYEVPFDEPAFILIFKSERDEKDDGEFLLYLQGLKRRLEKAHAEGTPFLMSELPFDHPAREFARRLGLEGR